MKLDQLLIQQNELPNVVYFSVHVVEYLFGKKIFKAQIINRWMIIIMLTVFYTEI